MAVAVAASVATALVGSCVILSELAYCGVGLAVGLKALFPAWILGIMSAAGCAALDRALAGSAHPLVRFVTLGVLFCVIFGVLVRAVLRNHLREAVTVLPSRFRGRIARFMLLGHSP